MADRNEVFRIILEGRDRLSRELDGVRRSADKLDESLKRLKRNKPDDFPLFGGGRATRGPGGQFIKKEDISLVDQMRERIDRLNNSIAILKRNKPQEFPLFGGGRAVRGDDGRFIRVQDVTLLEKAKNRLDAIDKALVRIRTRVRRGPLTEDELPGAGATRLVRTATGQFARAEDLSLVRRLQREFAVLGRGIRQIQTDTRQGLILGTERTVANLKKVRTFVDDIKNRVKEALLGSGKTRTGVDQTTGRFISVADVTAFGKFVQTVENGAQKMVAANKKVAQSQREIRAELFTSLKTGFDISKRTQEIIDQNISKSKEELDQKKRDLNEEQELEKVNLSAREDRLRSFLAERLEDKREADRLEIEDLRRHIRSLGKTEEDEEEKSEARASIASIQRERRRRERETSAALTGKFQRERANLRITQADERRSLVAPDIGLIEKTALEERTKAINEAETALGRMGRRAGLAFGDVVRGAKSARSGLKDMDRDIRLVNNAFTRFGFAVGQVFRHFDQLVNLRWLFLTGILTIFFTLITQIGTALVALAASAIQAGAAIGGAFLSGIAEALPVVGLLTAAFSRFNTVLDAVKLNEKLGNKVKDNVDQIKQAAQRLADSQYSLKKAIEAVGDAQYAVVQANKDLKDSYKDVRNATKDLAEAKIQAARDIVDANLEEKDAALSLQEAELGVLDAKKKLREEEEKARKGTGDKDEARAALREAQDRLRIAKQQGDQSEISAAQQQVTLAEQNLNAILDQIDSSKQDLKDAELGVKRANLTVEQARVRNSRAKQDAKTARDEGIKGSDVVKSAQDQLKQAIESVANSQRNVLLANRNVRDSLHQVAIAQREVADARKEESDARKGQSQADKDAQKAFADLSPAEKKLFNSLKRLRKVFKDVFVGNSERDGILGPITEAIARFADTLTKLLLDPQIQKAARNLAQVIADAFDKFRKFVASDEFKQALLFFTKRAADNIPRVVDGMLNLARAFLNIAKAADPIFTRLLKGAVGLTGKLKDVTSQKGEVRRPEEGGPGAGIATINESGLDRFLASAEKHLDAWLKLSGAIINLIAAITTSPAAGGGKTLIEDLTDQLNNFADFFRNNPEKVQKFFDEAVKSIENLTKILGRLSEALFKSFSSDEFTAFVQLISEVVIPGLLLLIGTLGLVSKILLGLFKIPVVGGVLKWYLAFLVFEKGLNKLFPFTQKITEGIKKIGEAAFRSARILLAPGGLKAAIDAVKFEAEKAYKATKKLGDNLADMAKRGATNAASAARRAKNAIFAMGNAALEAASKIGKVLYLALTRLVAFIYTGLLRALLALRLSVRLLVSATVIGALITAGILLIQNWDKVKKYAKILADFLLEKFKAVVDWVKDNWKKVLIGLLLAPFLPAGLLILGILKFKNRILGIFGDIKDGIIDRFRAAFNWVREKLSQLGDWVSNKLHKLPIVGRFFGGGGDDEAKKPVVIQVELTPKAKRDAEKIPTKRATGGVIPGHGVLDTVPALLTPGEWVLNKAQQEKLIKLIGLSKAKAIQFLFGTTGALTAGDKKPAGLIAQGNIDILHRPQIKNANGTTSTVLSGTFTTDAGTYVLPHVIGNKIVSDEEAFSYFKKTGQHLGLFQTVNQAENYSQKLHLEQAALGRKLNRDRDTIHGRLHVGDWVLNSEQQKLAAALIHKTIAQTKATLFGTNSKHPPAHRGKGTKNSFVNRKAIRYRDFNLVSQDDDDGNTIWFIELDNGTFGQVTKRDADRIQTSKGTYIPGYVKRSVGGFSAKIQKVMPNPIGGLRAFSMGGIVTPGAVQRFAEGGVVQAAGHGNTSSQKNVTQNFSVTTQGETDWGYVMRLGAIHAQESF